MRSDAALLPNAIEESWRWCSSVVGTGRFVEREVTIAGETLTPGTIVQLGLLATNYGGGRHYCAGAALARMETRVAISRLLARFPGLRADPGRPPPNYMLGTRGGVSFGPDHLPVCLDEAHRRAG